MNIFKKIEDVVCSPLGLCIILFAVFLPFIPIIFEYGASDRCSYHFKAPINDVASGAVGCNRQEHMSIERISDDEVNVNCTCLQIEREK